MTRNRERKNVGIFLQPLLSVVGTTVHILCTDPLFFSLSKFLCRVLITIVWVQMFWWTHSLLDKYPNEQVPFFADICQNRKNEMVQGTCRHLEGPNPTGLIQVGMHLSLLGFYPKTWQACKLSINLLTLTGLSTNISVDNPATVSRCMVKS